MKELMSEVTLRSGYLPGCIGRIAQLHALYYSAHVNFGVEFEAKVAKGLSDFCLQYQQDRDGLWFALRDRQIEGSIAIDASHHEHDGAHLRWFITSDVIRGTGAGTTLLRTALDFCRARRYARIYLWTFEGLPAARHLYEKHGFRLATEFSGRQWGSEVNEQRFELELTSASYRLVV